MKSYFYRVKYGTNPDSYKTHWLFGKFENKNAVIEAANGKAIEVFTTKQIMEKFDPDQIRRIARNCLVYQPHVLGEFPAQVTELLK